MNSPKPTSFIMTLPDGRRQSLTSYSFKSSGDEIPLHVHDFWHSCCCTAGSVELYDENGKTRVVMSNQFAEFSPGRKHGIRALSDNTVTIHMAQPGEISEENV